MVEEGRIRRIETTLGSSQQNRDIGRDYVMFSILQGF
jgi:hypothetical protein